MFVRACDYVFCGGVLRLYLEDLLGFISGLTVSIEEQEYVGSLKEQEDHMGFGF